MHHHRTLADSVRCSPVWNQVSQPYLPASPLASKFKLLSYTSRSGLQPGRKEPTMPSADFCRFILPPHDGSSTRQTSRSPRVKRATFTFMPATFTTASSVQVSGFEDISLLTQYGRLICDFCSSGQCFACGFLQISPRDEHPCRSANRSPCRAGRGLSPPSHPTATTTVETALNKRCTHAWRTKKKQSLDEALRLLTKSPQIVGILL